MLDDLNEQQKEFLEKFRAEWIKISQSTERVDPDKARDAVARLYQFNKLRVPPIVFLSSPIMCEFALNVLKIETMDEFRKTAKEHTAITDMFLTEMYSDTNKDQLTAEMKKILKPYKLSGSPIGTDYLDWKDICSKLKITGTHAWGCHDSYWVAFYEFGRQIGKGNYDENTTGLLDVMLDVCKTSYWFYPFDELCLISDRPCVSHMDMNNRLHNPDGIAYGFTDGYGIYSMSGVTMPRWTIEEKEKLNAETIIAESNAEIRRQMMVLYGWDKFLTSVKAKLLDKDPDPLIGELWSFKDVDGVEIKINKALNGTPEMDGSEKWYSFRVPTDTKRAIDGNRWTYPLCREMSDEDYREWTKCRT
jgi:hypothetical protein